MSFDQGEQAYNKIQSLVNNEILFRLFSSGLNLHRSLCVGCLL